MRFIKNILFMFKYSWNISKRIYAAAVIKIMLDSIEPFIYLIFPALIINELSGARDWNTVLLNIGLFVGAVAILRASRLISSVFVNMSVNRCDVKNGMFYARHFLIMPYEKLEDEKVRDMQQTVSAKVRVNSFYETFIGLITSIIKLIGFSYIITMLDRIVLIFIFGTIVIKYFLNKKLSKNDYKYQPILAKHTRKFDYLFEAMTNFDYAKEVRVNKADEILSNKFNITLSSFNNDNKKFLFHQLCVNILSGTVTFAQMLLSYGYAVYSAVKSLITVGEFSLYIGAVYNLSESFGETAEKCIELKYMTKYVDGYHEYIKVAMSQNTENEVNVMPEEDKNLPMFEFDHVSFIYPNTEKVVLNNISIKIQKSEKLSIVGLNGAGKTTFIKLLCRLYTPTRGIIKYFGVDISTIKREEYMKALAVVFQDFKIFSFSLLDNIVLNQQLVLDKLNKSVENVGLASKVKSLPRGFDTSIYKDFDEEGIEFSGGEGQKLVIARAYYKDAGLVILDEPTAALDVLSENQIYQNFNELTSGKTSIFISHRLASTRFCDKIAVFENGNIVEYGSHEELMKSQGLYAEMFEKQAEYYNTEEAVQ